MIVQENELKIYKRNLTLSEAKKIIDVLKALGYNFSHFESGTMIFVDARDHE